MVTHRSGGDPGSANISPGQTKYEAITLERGVTHDIEFENWRTWSGRTILNTMTANLMVNLGQLAGGDHTVLMSGHDAGAKTQAAELLKSLGWRTIVDIGDIVTARGAEILMPIWIRLMGTL